MSIVSLFRRVALVLVLSWASFLAPSFGEESGGAPSADEVAKQLANPNNSLASLTFKNQFRGYQGDLPRAGEQFNYTNLFQPVFPFSLGTTDSGGKSNLFIRPAIPILFDQPVPYSGAGGFEFDETTALGDMGFDIAYGVTEPTGFIWALGMVGTLPTATSSSVAGKQVRLGPEFVVAQATDWGIVALFPSHQWDVTGWGGGDFNTSQLQAVVKVLPGGGWSIGSSPILQHNWETQEWTIPLNLTLGKTVVMGKTPVKLELDANYYVSSPSAFGPEWMIGINITPVVPNFVEAWIRK